MSETDLAKPNEMHPVQNHGPRRGAGYSGMVSDGFLNLYQEAAAEIRLLRIQLPQGTIITTFSSDGMGAGGSGGGGGSGWEEINRGKNAVGAKLEGIPGDSSMIMGTPGEPGYRSTREGQDE